MAEVSPIKDYSYDLSDKQDSESSMLPILALKDASIFLEDEKKDLDLSTLSKVRAFNRVPTLKESLKRITH